MKQIGIWGGITAVLVATIWGLIVLVNNSNPSSILSSQVTNVPPVGKDDVVFGTPEKANAILIEYGDFQCPACKNFAPLVRQLGKDFGDKLLTAYRFFPLTNKHQNAMSSAQAAFAASKQNKFWEMSDLIYANQENWANSANAPEIFTEYAKKLGLNTAQFTNDFNSDTTKKFITDEENQAISIGINSTPTFFVNGAQIQNPQNYEAFKQLIQNAINKK